MKIIHDFFPATIIAVPPNAVEDFKEVTTSVQVPKGGRYMERVRVIVMKDDESHVLMVAADASGGPRLVFSERLSDLNWSGDKKLDSQALTRSGKIIAFKYVHGCSCGSRLRSFSPYRTMDSIKDPTA
jgi:hypothetical protein